MHMQILVIIKMSGGELWDQEEAVCMHACLQAYTTTTVSYLAALKL